MPTPSKTHYILNPTGRDMVISEDHTQARLAGIWVHVTKVPPNRIRFVEGTGRLGTTFEVRKYEAPGESFKRNVRTYKATDADYAKAMDRAARAGTTLAEEIEAFIIKYGNK